MHSDYSLASKLTNAFIFKEEKMSYIKKKCTGSFYNCAWDG